MIVYFNYGDYVMRYLKHCTKPIQLSLCINDQDFDVEFVYSDYTEEEQIEVKTSCVGVSGYLRYIRWKQPNAKWVVNIVTTDKQNEFCNCMTLSREVIEFLPGLMDIVYEQIQNNRHITRDVMMDQALRECNTQLVQRLKQEDIDYNNFRLAKVD